MPSRTLRALSVAFLVLAVGTSHGSAPPVVRVDAHGDPLPPGALARYGTRRLCHEGVTTMAFANDGKHLLTFSGQSGMQLRLWDVATGKLLRERQMRFQHAFEVMAVAPDGGIYLVGHTGGVRYLKGLQGREERIRDEEFPHLIQAVLSPDGKLLAIHHENGKLLVLDVPAGEVRLRTEVDHADARTGFRSTCLVGLAFSDDGKLLAVASGDGEVVLWDTKRRANRHVFPGTGVGGNPRSGVLRFSPRGDLLYFQIDHHPARLFDTVAGKEVAGFRPPAGTPPGICFSPDGKQLVAIDHDRRLCRLDLPSGKERVATRVPILDREARHRVAFSRDRKTAAVAGETNLYSIDLETGKWLHPRLGYRQPLCATRLAGGAEMVSLAFGGRPQYWDRRTGKHLRTWKPDTPSAPILCDLHPRADLALSQHDARTTKVLRISDGKELWRAAQGEELTGKTISPDGRWLTTLGKSGLEVRDSRTGTLRQSWPLDAKPARHWSVAWSPCGRRLASMDPLGNEVRVHELGVEKPTQVLRVPLPAGASFCPRTGHLAVISRDGVIRVFAQGKPTPRFEVVVRVSRVKPAHDEDDLPTEFLTPIAFSPDGRFLAAGCSHDVRIWDTAGKPVRVFRGHEHDVLDLTFADDGRTLVSTSEDGTALIWDLAGVK